MKTSVARSLILLAACLTVPLAAQEYPVKAVRVVVGIAPGGGLDGGTRLMAAKLGELLQQQFVVENRPGAGSTIAAALVAKAPADGYTLLMAGGTSFVIAPVLYRNLSYDPVQSFAPVGTAGTEVLVLVVHPSVPAGTPAELIAVLKANPGKYSYGSPGNGSGHHLAMELFQKQAGVRMNHVPYKGAAQIVPDLVSGRVPVAIMSTTSTLPQAKAGKIRALALTSPLRLASVPEWPPLAETLPDYYDMGAMRFVLAPAGTPAAVVNRLSESLKAMLAMDEVRRIFHEQGTMAQFLTPAALAARIRTDVAQLGALAREVGVKAD
ncbi:MAG: tripartite tricarboxylate transporter substrate binding protein [Burkholderiales bacterium]|nr:tripartite tricarboxylate transporter substrate binding protein [Burkholderiales bacterium]